MLTALWNYCRKMIRLQRSSSVVIRERHPRESRTTPRGTRDSARPRRNDAVKGGFKPTQRDTKLANGEPSKQGSGMTGRSRRAKAKSYQPTAEVILFLPDENGTRTGGSSNPMLSTHGRKPSSRTTSPTLGSANNRSPSPRTNAHAHRPSSVQLFTATRLSRFISTRLAANAKGDLPPIPVDGQNQKALPKPSANRLPCDSTQHRSRHSKLLPPTPTIAPRPHKESTPEKFDSRRSGRDLIKDMRSPRVMKEQHPKLVVEENAGQYADGPNPARRRSSLRSIGWTVTRKLSLSSRRQNNLDGDRTERARLPSLSIPRRMSRFRSTGTLSSVVIQPTTPAGGRKSIRGTTKHFLELEAHVTEEELPARIKRILQRRGADDSESSQSRFDESPMAGGEMYHSDLNLAIEVLRDGSVMEDISITSPVD